ncbi:MAG: hypothetical protein F6J95_014615 [Leptolyngbya sp. SIO1E4]|nr:hypothetical protein [Leptolyngbya sp. SIO1E4]
MQNSTLSAAFYTFTAILDIGNRDRPLSTGNSKPNRFPICISDSDTASRLERGAFFWHRFL